MTGFSDKQIVSMLEVHSLWSRRACREILRRPDDFIPLLIDILDKTINDPESFGEGDSHIPAAILLAQLREKQAYTLLVDLINYDEDSIEYIWGDVLTELYVGILRDTFNGDTSLLKKVIENRLASSWARAMAVYAWGMLYYDGHIDREEIKNYFLHLIHKVYNGKLNEDDETVVSYIANAIREQQLEELIGEVQKLYARKAIDNMICGSVEDYVKDFKNPLYGLENKHIDDAIKELEEWRWFEVHEPDEEEDDDDYYDYDDDDFDDDYDEEED